MISFTSRGGFTQSETLSMILYGLDVLPIFQDLKHHVEGIDQRSGKNELQVWYANELSLDFYFSSTKYCFNLPPSLGYDTNPDKTLPLMLEANLDLETTFFS